MMTHDIELTNYLESDKFKHLVINIYNGNKNISKWEVADEIIANTWWFEKTPEQFSHYSMDSKYTAAYDIRDAAYKILEQM